MLPLASGTPKESPQQLQYCKTLSATQDDVEPAEIAAAWKLLEEKMSLVPAGDVILPALRSAAFEAIDDLSIVEGIRASVTSVYFDRFAVTNQEFYYFVEDGGYAQEELWPQEILPITLQFVDSTGCSGPRPWSNGKPASNKLNHPVVGVCWYEANAFARWVGKRLPTGPEWQRAGTWSASDSFTAKYPWGESFDGRRANTWNGGQGDTVAVDEYYDGCTPNGVYQLVGNVWEWVATLFELEEHDGKHVLFDQPMAEIRGGAFDTYFASQASCQFRTGQPLLYRGLNVGFRCCVNRDLLQLRPDPYAFLEESAE